MVPVQTTDGLQDSVGSPHTGSEMGRGWNIITAAFASPRSQPDKKGGWIGHLSCPSLNPLWAGENLALNLLQTLSNLGLCFRDYMEKYFKERQLGGYF